MLLTVFAHVDTRHRAFVVEEELGEGLRHLGLADASGAEEEEGPRGAIRICHTCARTSHGIGHGTDRIDLAHDTLAELIFHAQELRGLTLEKASGGDSCPCCHDLCDVVRADLFAHHARPIGCRGRGSGELDLEGRNLCVQQA
ncbi:unannotated protein [freshwater metagenome]|uniref:Unannotated protein n=1 Tax=freshwater metagenome TaxID=449393 RepID=A0A6J7BT84_9ZZZZ